MSFHHNFDHHVSNNRQSILPPRQTFSFPSLKTDEIVKCLQELGIQIHSKELMNPEENVGTVRGMLEILAEICTGIAREEMYQPAFAGLKAINYPQLHEESIPQLNLFRACTKMMEVCEIHDFTVKDLMSPTAARLKRHLSGIINFCKFREERLVLLADLSTSRAELLDQVKDVQEKNEALNNRLNILREQTSDEGELINRLEGECRDMASNMKELNTLQVNIRNETDDLQRTNGELKENIAHASKNLEEAYALKSKLSSQIVSSPEKFRKQIIEVGQNLQNEQKDIKTAERKIRDLTAWIQNLDECQSNVSSGLESMHEVRSEVERQKTTIIELDSTRATIATNRAALSELDQNVHQLNRHATRAEEKLSALKKQATKRGTDTQNSIEDLHRQLVDAEAFRLKVRARQERVDGEISRLDQESEAETRANEQEIAEMAASYHRLEKVVVTHLRHLQHMTGSGDANRGSGSDSRYSQNESAGASASMMASPMKSTYPQHVA